MQHYADSLTIGSLAKTVGVNVETIRFYQRKGLLLEPNRYHGNIRRYTESDVARVRFIKSAQRLGFSLDEVADLLQLNDGTHCKEASDLAEQKLEQVRKKQEDLMRIENALSKLVSTCRKNKENVSCPLIESLFQL